MVTFLSLPEGAGHIDGLTRAYGRAYTHNLSEVTYHQVLQGQRVPLGAFVFLDLERINRDQRGLAIRVGQCLESYGSDVRIYNHPKKQLGRYDLLRTLTDRGANGYRAHMVGDLPENASLIRFPVFIRVENDHMGSRTGIIHTREELDRAVDRLTLLGLDPGNLIVIEYLEIANDEGIYRRYGALRIGPMISCNHVYLSHNWMVKSETAIKNEETRAESEEYYLTNPHAGLLLPIFELAGIEYGRIDYAMVDGQIQVWEINDNPQYGPGQVSAFHRLRRHERWAEGFASLDRGMESSRLIQIDVGVAIQ